MFRMTSARADNSFVNPTASIDPMRLKTLALLLLAALGASGCNTVEFYEKGALSSPVMALDMPASLLASEQKIFYSTEGAAGGLGSTAGGGCGCY